MDGYTDDGLWPKIPAELKYVEFRLPGTFRELVANRDFTNEEIGKIIRCLALDTDMFLTQRIEEEVYYYRRHLIEKNKTRKRVAALRERRKKAAEAGHLSAAMRRVEVESDSVTVTGDDEKQKVGPIFGNSTPNPLIEKTPPIIPLEKKSPIPLNAGVPKAGSHKGRARRHRPPEVENLPMDLFALAAGGAEPSIDVPPQGTLKSKPEGTVVSSEGSGGADVPPACPSDSRADYAWIPQKFATFWNKYPKKLAKRDALKAFTKIIKAQPDVDAFMGVMMASLAWWKEQDAWKKDGGKFIPYPATWLNGGHWEDIKDNEGSAGGAEFLRNDSESDEELMRRMQGGQ